MRMNINKILLLLSVLALAACSDNDLDTKQTLSGEGKSPLTVTALLDANSKAVQTRAADKEFASGDKLHVYLRHVTWDGTASDDRTPVTADQAPRLVTFSSPSLLAWENVIDDIYPFDADKYVTLTADDSNLYGVTGSYTSTSGATVNALYWDDFSQGKEGDDTHLRTDNHYLQSYYGYCYNGGTPSTVLEESTGKLGWSVQLDQSTEEAFMKSDLLWSAEQIPVKYEHEPTLRNGLIIPYTHAMSKVTIEVKAGEGFASDYNFSGTEVTLSQVRTTCTAKAPTAKLDCESSVKDVVKMQPLSPSANTCMFQAIIVPTVLSVGNTFATITNMGGNTYNIPITENIIKVSGGWGGELDNATEDVNNGVAQAKPRTRADGDVEVPDGKGHQMRSGVHYKLTVTVNKTAATVSASILDWTEVEAEGLSEVYFEHDIKDGSEIDKTIDAALKENGFYVYKSADNSAFGAAATKVHWNKVSEVWKYEPVIYWDGSEYFRALANVPEDVASTPTNESLTMENGKDALWGTTQAENGTYTDGTTYDYEEGDKLDPRTGTVPLKFYHAMSKITFNLVDANADGDELAKIDLKNATIQLTNLATGGTLNLDKGTITRSDVVEKTFSEDTGASPKRMGFYAAAENEAPTSYTPDLTLKNYIITPQTIGNEAMVIITLADGSVYKAQLNLCTTTVIEDGVSTPKVLKEWERGKHYTYTITLSKEKIMFRALIENWVEKTGNGIANLEWDSEM